jgi:hypothetical protein
MTRNIEVWQLQPGDTVNVKGDAMMIKTIDSELTGISLNLIDSKGRGHFEAYGHDDIVPIVLP